MEQKKVSIVVVFLGLLVVSSVFLIVIHFQSKIRNNISDIASLSFDQTEVFKSADGTSISTEKTVEKQESKLPEKYLLSAPFASQAPYGDWSEPYENACEEASLIMVNHYLQKKSLSKEEMKSEIDNMVAWQMENWKEHRDLDSQASLLLAKQYLNLNGKVISALQADNIKKYIASGLPVIAPTAGRKLGNPNFRGAGPEYHMLVIIGYDDAQGIFITNDPGTRKGESYIYKYQTLLDAISGPKEDMTKELVVLSN